MSFFILRPFRAPSPLTRLKSRPFQPPKCPLSSLPCRSRYVDTIRKLLNSESVIKIRVSSVFDTDTVIRSYSNNHLGIVRHINYLSSSSCLRQLEKVKMPEKKAFERLPKTVLPKHYYLDLKPDLKAFTFTGKTKIDLQVRG